MLDTGMILAGAVTLLLLWYALWKGLLPGLLGIDPHRTRVKDKLRGVDTWVLTIGQAALMIGAAPLFGYTIALQFGAMPTLIWIVGGAMLLAAPVQVALLWLAVRRGEKNITSLMPEKSGWGKRVLAVLAWALCVVTIAVLADTAATGLDGSVQKMQPKDFVTDSAGYEAALDKARTEGLQLDIMPFVDAQAYETAQQDSAWESTRRAEVAAATVAVLLLALLFGRLVIDERRRALPWLLVILFLFGYYLLWSSGVAVITLPRGQWMILLFAYAAWMLFVPARKLSHPRDMLTGVFALGMSVVAAVGALMGPRAMPEPVFAGWTTSTTPMMLPILCTAMLAGGANLLTALSSVKRNTRYIRSERQTVPVALGGTLIAAFVGVVFTVGAVACRQQAVGAVGAFSGPREVMGAVAAMMAQTGLPYAWATQWVMLVCVGCAMGALDMATRLACSLLYDEFASDTVPGGLFAPERLLAALVTLAGAFLLVMDADYWGLWPYAGMLSLGLCGALLLTVTGWLRRAKRPRAWLILPALIMLLLALGAVAVVVWNHVA